MTSDHVADTKAPSKGAFLEWLSATGPAVLAKAPAVNYRLLTPVLATLVVSASLLACGSSDAPTSPDADQPTVVTATQPETANNAGDGQQAQTTVISGNGQSSDSASGGNPTPEPTDTPRPTPDNRPDETPAPEPTPTMVPTPTPNPKAALYNLLRGLRPSAEPREYSHNLLREQQEYYYLFEHNTELIEKAVAPHITDFAYEEYDIWTPKADFQHRVPYYIDNFHTKFERIPSDGDDLHVRVTMQYDASQATVELYVHEISVKVAFKAVEPPYESVGLTVPDYHAEHLDQVPTFSHLLGDPVIAAGTKR